MGLISVCSGILLIISLYGQCLGYEQTECSPVASCYPPCKLRTGSDGCKVCKCPNSSTTTQAPYSGESEHPVEDEAMNLVPGQPVAYDRETLSPYYAQENTPQFVVYTPSTSQRTVVYYPTSPPYMPPASTNAPAYPTAPVYVSAYTPSYQTQPTYPSLSYAPAYVTPPAYAPGYQTPPPINTQTYPTPPVYAPAYPSVTSGYQTPAYGITSSTSSYSPAYPAPVYTQSAYTPGYGSLSRATYSPGYPTPEYTASTTPAYQTPSYTPAYGAAPSPAYPTPPAYTQSYEDTPGRTTRAYPSQPTTAMNPNLPPCPGVVCPEWCRSIYDKQLGHCVVDCICS